MAASELSRYQANLQDKIDGVALYRALAEVKTDPTLAGIYSRLAEAEERHAELWRGQDPGTPAARRDRSNRPGGLGS